MKFVTYTATPGLERFPESERFRVYRSAHKQLKRQDGAFRRRVNRFQASIIMATVPLLLVTPATTPMFGHSAWQTITGLAIIAVSSLGYVGYVLVASFRLQAFQNEQIGRLLQSHAAEQCARVPDPD